MNLTNVIANMIISMLDENDEIEFRRNNLANDLGCVPSQINYVIASRFTPERGYYVESRRGGDGCIKITRVQRTPKAVLMHVINFCGDEIDEKTCKAQISNLRDSEIITQKEADVLLSATNNRALQNVPQEQKDRVRADIFKQVLLVLQQ